MGSTDRIKNVAARVAKWHDAGHQVIVVPSAMSGETNRLIGLAKEIMAQPDPRELDMIASTGEQVSVGLLAMALLARGKDAVSYTGWQVGIRTDSAFTKARIQSIDDTRVRGDLDAGKIVIITGFQGVDEEGNISTLGRGGSDTSAVAIAAAMKADECLIYTDVDGVYTTDPRVVEEARRLHKITFEEMLELASLGSKVLQTRSVEFAGNYRVPTRVLSSLTDPLMPLEEEANSGTLISFEEETNMEQAVISGIAFHRDEAILGPISDANIEVDMIIQNVSVDGKTDFTFTVSRNDYQKAMNVLEGVKTDLGAQRVMGDSKVSKVSVVGVGMRSHVGVAAQMFRTLSEEGINIMMISTSEIKISVLIDEKYMELAVRALHRAFELEKE
jgi:aspartate kinase